MKKRTKIIAGFTALIVVVLLLINAYYMGVEVIQDGGFIIGQSDIFKDIFPRREATFISIDGGRYRDFTIPRVISVCLLTKPPYDINFKIQDESQSVTEMVIDSVVVEYEDETEEKIELSWKKDFKFWPTFSSMTNGSGGVDSIYVPADGIKGKLDRVVTKNQSCTIKLNGYFVDANDTKRPFSTSNYFEYEPTSWYVSMYLFGVK